jgi:phage tail sheath protein FI
MPTYLSPGVYVEEVSSGLAPIAGVSTSTAAFIGIIKTASSHLDQQAGSGGADEPGAPAPQAGSGGTGIPVPSDSPGPQTYPINPILKEEVGKANGEKTSFELSVYPVLTTDYTVVVNGQVKTDGTELKNDDTAQRSRLTFTPAPPSESTISVSYYQGTSVKAGKVELCTTFADFKKFFGDFSKDESKSKGQKTLAHAVYGFFRNGGTRCYVVWVADEGKVDDALKTFEDFEEISLIAAPGVTDTTALTSITAHCEKLKNCFAIFDGPKKMADLGAGKPGENKLPGKTNYGALYFPWIEVYDFGTEKNIHIPPSGHIAGVYARVDNQRGVYKAPGNEVILGATGLMYAISKAQQDGLNPQGVNCIRNLNGNIRIWGARTWGGDANGEFKYINVRRLMNFIRESIDKGTQGTVFEPNSSDLWARIRRNVTAFLTMLWRSGALFGSTPAEAFYVKCDKETNPQDVIDAGKVVTEIGVAIVKPAEFVIFRISQWSNN